MASHFYQVCMGAYGETLFRSSKRDARQAIWLQYNLMRLGSEACGPSTVSTGSARRPTGPLLPLI